MVCAHLKSYSNDLIGEMKLGLTIRIGYIIYDLTIHKLLPAALSYV